MKRMFLIIVLGGLLSFGAGCGGDGGSDSDSLIRVINSDVSYTYTTENKTVKVIVKSLELRSNKLIVNCVWEASGPVLKKADADHTRFYMVADNGQPYNNTGGTGAAYTDTVLNPTATGSYYFAALDSNISSVRFGDRDNGQKTDWIAIK